MPIINRITGKQPTQKEFKAIKREAIRIFQSPYASPEQLQWAIDMYPEGFAETFVISDRPEWIENKLLGGSHGK